MRRRALAGALILALAGPAGCSRGERFDDVFSPVDVRLPGPVTAMAALGHEALLGTYDVSARPRAGLFRVSSTDDLVPLDITASSPYAFEGRFRYLATDGNEVTGLTGISGGAHGNVRWAVWRGAGPVLEQPQTFETFGGIDAGALTGVAYDATGPLLVGSWKSAVTGLDAAIWRPEGTRWVRAESAGTALANRADRLVQISAAATAPGGRALLAGAATDLQQGVRVAPLAWVERDGQWHAQELPTLLAAESANGVSTGVEAASCGPVWCVLAGRDHGELRAWLGRFSADGTFTVDTVRAPVRGSAQAGDTMTSLAPDQAEWVGTGVSAAYAWLALADGSGAGTVWRWPLPRSTAGTDGGMLELEVPGSPTAVAVAGDRVWLAGTAKERVALWSARG